MIKFCYRSEAHKNCNIFSVHSGDVFCELRVKEDENFIKSLKEACRSLESRDNSLNLIQNPSGFHLRNFQGFRAQICATD